jgi:hypothetical protein
MKSGRKSILSMLDDSVRWTGMPARIADQISGDPERKHPSMRWIPIWPIAFSCALLVTSLAWPAVLNEVPLGAIIGTMVSFLGSAFALLPYISMNGPLGKSSLEDDEREAALRKDSFLFCLALLAVLNCLGQPLLMILSHWQHWQISRIVCVVTSSFMLNATLFGGLPTLFASWNLRQLPTE